MPNAKIGVLYQNDAYGKNYYAGLRVGLGAKKSNIVDASRTTSTQANVDAADPRAEEQRAPTSFVDLRDADADDHRARRPRRRSAGRRRDVHQQRVGEPRSSCSRRRRTAATVDGVSRDDVRQELDRRQGRPGRMVLAKAIIDQYAPSLRPSFDRGDSNIVYGLGAAWTFVVCAQEGRQEPDAGRPDEGAEQHEHVKADPFVYPGIKLQTAPKDNFPIEQLSHDQVGRRRDRRLGSRSASSYSGSASTADVVVIGGGALGAATAFHLRRLGVDDVVLLERDALASGLDEQVGGRHPHAVRGRAEHPHRAALARRVRGAWPTRSRSGSTAISSCSTTKPTSRRSAPALELQHVARRRRRGS